MTTNGDKRSKLFEYAIIWQPKERMDANGNDTTPAAQLLVEPTRILVRDASEATIQAARKIPEEYLAKLDEVEIAVRPFLGPAPSASDVRVKTNVRQDTALSPIWAANYSSG